MPDYTKGKIYGIISEDKIYIGSTTQTIKARMETHRSQLKQHKLMCTSAELMSKSDVKCILLEAYPCTDKSELLYRERYWIEIYSDHTVVNKHRPIISRVEITQQKAKYYIEHKVESAKYYLDNKVEIAQYYLDNKAEILQQAAEIVKCEICGCNSTRHRIKRHQRSRKCIIEYEKINNILP